MIELVVAAGLWWLPTPNDPCGQLSEPTAHERMVDKAVTGGVVIRRLPDGTVCELDGSRWRTTRP